MDESNPTTDPPRSLIALTTAKVELRCGAMAVGRTYLLSASFVRRCLSGSAMTPFPHPAHRTGQADLPHPALGQDRGFQLWLALPPDQELGPVESIYKNRRTFTRRDPPQSY